MKATVFEMKIQVKVLSLDAIPGLLQRMSDELRAECIKGSLRMEDGDKVMWKTKQRPAKL